MFSRAARSSFTFVPLEKRRKTVVARCPPVRPDASGTDTDQFTVGLSRTCEIFAKSASDVLDTLWIDLI